MPSQTQLTHQAIAQVSLMRNREAHTLPHTRLLLHARLKHSALYNCCVTDLSITVVLVKVLVVQSEVNF